MSFAAYILVAVLFVISVVPFFKWYMKRAAFARIINRIPGPKTYPLIGTVYIAFGVQRQQLYKLVQSTHDQYPYINRLWMGPAPQVELKRAEHIEKVLNSGKLHLQKAWYYHYISEWLGAGLLTSDGAKWHARRRIITPTFHFSILESFCEIFAEKSKILVDKLDRHSGTGQPIDVYPYITKAALDIIADAAMGTQVNAQDEIENEYVQAVYQTAELIIRRMLRPWLMNKFVYKLSSDGKQFYKCVNVMQNFTKNVIRQRRAMRQNETSSAVQLDNDDDGLSRRKKLAFLDLLLDTNENGRNVLSDDDIREEVDTFMFEGHDTTTSGIAWTLFLLGLHPQVQENVFNELNEIFQGSDRSATIHDLNEMKLLDRVIKETMRLYPPVPIIGRTAGEDIQIDQYTIPAGCTINVMIVQLHQDERYFPDHNRFDPDRFLPENIEGRHPFAYIPFSAGARNCIGQKFAVYEEKSVLSSIIRNYRFTTIGKRENIDQVFELILRPIDGIPLTLERRIK